MWASACLRVLWGNLGIECFCGIRTGRGLCGSLIDGALFCVQLLGDLGAVIGASHPPGEVEDQQGNNDGQHKGRKKTDPCGRDEHRVGKNRFFKHPVR